MNTTDIVQRQYAERDHIAQGEFYLRHVDAMTGEGLHAKSAIAAELAHRDMEITRLRAEAEALRKDAERWRLFTKTVSLGFDGAPHWNAVMRFPVFSHDDQTITALVDRWANVYAETALDATKGTT